MIHRIATVRQSRIEDSPSFSGPTLRQDGTLGIYSRGTGLLCGPMEPGELRSFALAALAIADALDTQAACVSEQVDQELARIVASGNA